MSFTDRRNADSGRQLRAHLARADQRVRGGAVFVLLGAVAGARCHDCVPFLDRLAGKRTA